jgi:hypothetical protein
MIPLALPLLFCQVEAIPMKPYLSQTMICAALVCTSTLTASAQGKRGRPPRSDLAPAPAGTYTTVSGVISQFNYDRDAEVEGFLLSNKALVHLPPRAAARLAPSLHTGDNVQVSGFAQISPSGFQKVEAQSLQDRTSGKTFTVPQPGPAAPYSGSGRIQQLNYGPDGAVNGFLLSDGNLVAIPPFSASNPTSIRTGATISYSGYARRTMSDRTVVNAQTLTVNGQQLALTAPASPRGPRGAAPPPAPVNGPGAPGPDGRGAATPPPPPPPRSSATGAPNPQGPPPQNRTAEPPPPPPVAPPQ